MREGIWLGTNERTEENIIGTNVGVVKCRTVQRKPEGSQWNAAQLVEMRGSAQQPVPGLATDKIPTGIMDASKCPVKPKAYAPEKPRYIPDKPATRMASAPRALNIFKKDVAKYDPTPGCRACTEVITGRDENRKSITQNIPHSQDCRARMTELMRLDEIDKARVSKAEGRKSRFQDELDASRATTNDDKTTKDDDKEEEDEVERDTDVALSLNNHNEEKTDFQVFLNNIHVGFACAVEEYNEVSEV